LATAYNDWAYDYCQADPARLFPCGLLALQDIDGAVQEVRRLAKKGFKTVAVRPVLDALAAEPWGDATLGLVGHVSSVEQIGIRALLASGLVPVIPPTAGGLNVNADHAAAAVASALRASELIFLSDVPGVIGGDGHVLRRVSATSVPGLIDAGHVTGGMIPKLDAGLAAIAGGVWRVWIGAETMVTA